LGSGGLQYDANDGFSAARGNQKSTFVGTGTQIAALGVTYAGQRAYSTDTSASFTINVGYIRNAANNAWEIEFDPSGVLIESAEISTTPTTDNADFTPGAGGQFDRYYEYHTLPTTEKFYIIMGIEWKNGATVNGNVVSGVDIVDSNPPTINHTLLAGLGQQLAQSGVSAIQRTSVISSTLIRGGTILGMWFSTDSTTSTFRHNTAATSKVHSKALAATQVAPSATENTAFVAANTNQVYLKLYYRGYE